jgi:thymidine phosphorylase
MAWQDVSEAFIRGIGKTSGTIFVLGVLTGVWYLVENRVLKQSKSKTNSETQTQEETEVVVSDEEEWRFKKMFERFT